MNNKKTEIHHINHSFMGVALEKGENIIEFEYRPSLIIIGFYISLISTFLSIIYLLLVRIRILKND